MTLLVKIYKQSKEALNDAVLIQEPMLVCDAKALEYRSYT
jgi:hypothetical protein